MQYIVQSVASEDTIQLFDSGGSPVAGVDFDEVTVWIRKSGATGYTQKTILVGDWTDRTGGNYSLQFSSSDFDTLGLFRYKVISTLSAFEDYYDSLYVVASLPTFPVDPPTINAQTATPAGISPDPVYRGSTLTISGTNLDAALDVTIDDVSVPITSNTSSEIQVTVSSSVDLGEDQDVEVTTAGGTASSMVDVVLDPSDIPGSGLVNIYGYIYGPDGQPEESVAVSGHILEMPNLKLGVGFVDELTTVTTDSNGLFTISLPRGTYVEILIPKIRYRRVFSTPDSASVNLFTEIP